MFIIELFRNAIEAKITLGKIIGFPNRASSADAALVSQFTSGFSLGAIELFHFFLGAIGLHISRASRADASGRVFGSVGHLAHIFFAYKFFQKLKRADSARTAWIRASVIVAAAKRGCHLKGILVSPRKLRNPTVAVDSRRIRVAIPK